MSEGRRGTGAGAASWVAIVVIVGAVVGAALSIAFPPMPGPPGPGGPPGRGPIGLDRAAYVLSTIDLAMLLALLAVYVRTYRETRARFALGLSAFLAALTLQTVFGSTLLFGAFGFGPGGLGPFLFVSYLFETIALAIFLYLSLD